MKKEKVFFHPIDNSGVLTISWSEGSKGGAVEAKNGSGVGFFSTKGDLLCVIFDEVQSDRDYQILEFDRFRIEITVSSDHIAYSTTVKEVLPRARKKRPVV